jgi:hypothetical protein
MPPSNDNIKGAIRANMILFYALILGCVIFLVIVIGIIQLIGPSLKDKELDKIFLIANSVIALLCLVLGNTTYRKKMNRHVSSGLTLNEKLNLHREAMIIYFAACEGPALFAVINLFLTGNYWFIVIAIVMLAAMWYRMPTKHRITNDLQLSLEEQQQL